MITDIAPGFTDPVHESQTTFRAVLDALAEPGTIRELAGVATAPAPLSPTAAAIVATLCDFETTVWRDEALASGPVDAWIAFHTGAPRVADAAAAGFAVVGAGETAPAWESFGLGTDVDPSISTTVVLQVAGFGEGRRYRLSGPGIETTREIAVLGAPVDLATRGAANRELFPRGVDLILASPTAVVGLPRTTRIEEVA